MAESINTTEGREALARIVRQARGKKGVRRFAQDVGVSHAVISKLEHGLVQEPKDSTLLKIAPHTEFSLEDLKSILASRNPGEQRQFCTAQEAWIAIKSLPPQEKALLGQMILAELGGLLTPDH